MQIPNKSNFPQPGTVDNLFERLADYISQFDPTWIGRIQGVSDDDIKRLAELTGLQETGLEYPKSYQIYLHHMGKDDGELIEPPLIFRSFDWVCDFYEEIKEIDPTTLNSQILTVAGFMTGDQLSFDLRPPLGAEPELYVTADGEFFEFYSESWEKLLFQYAALKFEILRFRINLSFNASKQSLIEADSPQRVQKTIDILTRFSADEGFTPAWFNDRVHYCAFRDDLFIWVDFINGSNLVMSICGSEEKATRRMGNQLAKDLDLELTLINIK